ncbi:MAG: NTP transferase domain-containing protein [Pseudomonadota bacterium]|nr:NTP transferase domain-containing protein [Pseudomonadota bacterium]
MIICVICARGGSKRLIGKNRALFLGKPLIVRCVETCMAFGFDDVVVSTDDEEIANLAHDSGAIIRHRNAELAADDTPKAYALRDAVVWYEQKCRSEVEFVFSVQANSPGITVELIERVKDRLIHGYGEVSTIFSNLVQNPAVRAFSRKNLFDDFYSTYSAAVIFDGEDVHTKQDLLAAELQVKDGG